MEKLLKRPNVSLALLWVPAELCRHAWNGSSSYNCPEPGNRIEMVLYMQEDDRILREGSGCLQPFCSSICLLIQLGVCDLQHRSIFGIWLVDSKTVASLGRSCFFQQLEEILSHSS